MGIHMARYHYYHQLLLLKKKFRKKIKLGLQNELPPNVEYPSGQGLPPPKLKGCTNVFGLTSPVLSFSQINGFLAPQLLSKIIFDIFSN